MTARKEKLWCESARECYFSLLFPDDGEPVPEDIRRHVEECVCCSERLSQMRALLSGLAQFGGDKRYYIRQLVRHFSLVKTEVDCAQVKQLLPLLADGRFNIPFPTPVTVHADQCAQCAHDLKTLRSLALSSRQLVRLADFLAKESFEGSEVCAKVEEFVGEVAQMRLERVERAVLDHICLCRKCRAALYDERLRLKGKTTDFETEIVPLPCGSIQQIDLYDYVVPYGLDEAQDKYVCVREALAEHLRQCPACLEKMRQLHNIIYTIDNRGNSGVTTWYELSPAEVMEGFDDASAEYADFPVNVQVCRKEAEEPVPVGTAKSALLHAKRHFKLNLTKWIRPIGIAATIMIIAGVFFFNAPTSQAVALAQVYEAVGNVLNVCVSVMEPGESNPVQRIWTSEKRGLLLIADAGRSTVWDVSAKTARSRAVGSESIRITSLSEEAIAKTAEMIRSYADIMPFPDESKIPAGWEWKQVDTEGADMCVPGATVYDLIWSEESGVHRRWREFIDIQTNLPKRTEVYQKLNSNEEFVLKTVMVFEYPTESELLAAIASSAVN